MQYLLLENILDNDAIICGGYWASTDMVDAQKKICYSDTIMSVVLPGQPLGPPGASSKTSSLGTYVDANGVPRSSLIGLFKDKVSVLIFTPS
jgi:hypothetical protein